MATTNYGWPGAIQPSGGWPGAIQPQDTGGDTFTAAAAVTIGSVTASGSGTFTSPVYSGSSAVTIAATTASGTATFAPPIYTATSAVVIAAVTASGSGTFTAPVYTASSAVSVGAVTASGSAIFAAAVYSGVGAVTTTPVVAAATATFTAPVYTGSGSVTTGVVTVSGTATFVVPVYTGLGAVTIGAVTASGTGTFSPPVYTASAAVSTGVVTASGTATSGSCDYPVVGNVRYGVSYANGSLTGTLVLPSPGDVRLGVQYGASGTEYTGTLVISVGPIQGSNLLLHSPADIIRWLLISMELGEEPQSLVWPVCHPIEPDSPDQAITVYDTAGILSGRTAPDSEMQEHHGFQIRIRSVTPNAGYARAREIAIGLDENVRYSQVVVDDTTYTVDTVVRQSDVLYIGKDKPANRLHLHVINALMVVRKDL